MNTEQLLKIEFTDVWEKDGRLPESDRWMAACEPFKIVVVGKTKQDAFNELMTSIRVMFLYNNKLTDVK